MIKLALKTDFTNKKYIINKIFTNTAKIEKKYF